MNTSKSENAVFDICASCTVIAVGAALAALLYELFTLTVSLFESMLWSANVALRNL
jgi:hypothetical protein